MINRFSPFQARIHPAGHHLKYISLIRLIMDLMIPILKDMKGDVISTLAGELAAAIRRGQTISTAVHQQERSGAQLVNVVGAVRLDREAVRADWPVCYPRGIGKFLCFSLFRSGQLLCRVRVLCRWGLAEWNSMTVFLSNYRGETCMPAYIVLDIDVTDPVVYEEYKKLAPALVASFGGRYLARGGRTEVLEGTWEPGRWAGGSA